MERKTISENMSDKERAKILKRKILTVVECDKGKVDKNNPELLDLLSTAKRLDAQPLLKKLAEEFNVFGQYSNADTELTFTFGSKALRESTFKQGTRYADYALMLTRFDNIVKNAVGIECHKDRYNLTPNLDNCFVLLGAFSDGERICPVKLEIKSLIGQQNKLHIAVTKSDIKKADVYAGRFRRTHPGYNTTRSACDISIHQFVKKINSFDGDLLKYFPDRLLTAPQRNAATDARAAEIIYTERKLTEQKARLAVRGQEKPNDAPAPKTLELGKASELHPQANKQIKKNDANKSRGKDGK